MRPKFKPSPKGLSVYTPLKQVLRLRASFNTYTGYGLHASYIARSFFSNGFQLKAFPISQDENCFDDVKDLLVESPLDGNVLQIAPPETKVDGSTWFFTMHETTQLAQAALANVRRSEVVIVPSLWCQQCFDAQGISPTYVVPIGLNTGFFYPAKKKPSLCVFGSAGNLALSGPNRKNMGLLITAFMEAFRNEKDVRLTLKVRPECPVPDLSDSRITVIRQHFSEMELSDWYRSLTAYVSPSRCEAFGQMNLQAMACCVPVICCNFAGVTEYHRECHGYNIEYKLVRPDDGYYTAGLWAEPDIDSLVEQLRRVYENRQEAARKGWLAQLVAQDYNWSAANFRLAAALKESGFWNPEHKSSKFVPPAPPVTPPISTLPRSSTSTVSLPVLNPVVSSVADLKSLWGGEFKPLSLGKVPLWLARRAGGREPIFYMSGDLGDIIYALPTIQGLGGGQLCIGPARDHPYYWLREPMTLARYRVLAPLLEFQKAYLSKVFWSEEMIGWKCHVDLNDSRRLHREPYYVIERNLADVASCFFGLGPGRWCQKWLSVDKSVAVARFVFARSARYHDENFPWKKIVQKLKASAVFIGLPSEYESFVAECGHVPFYPTANMLEVARILSGAEWLVCNQSAPLAVAEGLKTNVLLERFATAANCDYEREGHTLNPAHVLGLC